MKSNKTYIIGILLAAGAIATGIGVMKWSSLPGEDDPFLFFIGVILFLAVTLFVYCVCQLSQKDIGAEINAKEKQRRPELEKKVERFNSFKFGSRYMSYQGAMKALDLLERGCYPVLVPDADAEVYDMDNKTEIKLDELSEYNRKVRNRGYVPVYFEFPSEDIELFKRGYVMIDNEITNTKIELTFEDARKYYQRRYDNLYKMFR